jgi:hypothetical protein
VRGVTGVGTLPGAIVDARCNVRERTGWRRMREEGRRDRRHSIGSATN